MSYRILAKNKKTELIREYKPEKRCIVAIENQYERDEVKSMFLLQFPYLIYFFYDAQLHLAFAKRPITSMKSYVYNPTLGNVYEDFHVCSPPSRNLEGAIQNFWQSEFTSDGDRGHDALHSTFDGDSPLSSYTNWEKTSKRGENAVIKKLKNKISFKMFLALAITGYDYTYDEYNNGRDPALVLEFEETAKLEFEKMQFTFDTQYPTPLTLSQFRKKISDKKKRISAKLEKKRRKGELC